MSGSSLKSLQIQHLRGSVLPFTLAFEKGKKLSIIYGENGTGKTTICDALDFLGNGRVGSLDNRGLGKTHPYWPSVGKKAKDVVVKLETTSGDCAGTVHKGNVVANPAGLQPKVEVLRRSQILSLIEARPGERYEAIRRFIDVTSVEQSEASLRELIRTLNYGRETAVARVQENEEAIEKFWETAGKPGSDPLKWARQQENVDYSSLADKIDVIRNLRQAFDQLCDYPDQLGMAKETLETTQQQTLVAKQQLDEILNDVTEGAGDLVDLLHAALAYLESNPDPDKCPLCESQENAVGLRNHVNSRIQQYSSLTQAKQEKKRFDQDVQIAARKLDELTSSLLKDSDAFNDLVQKSDLSEIIQLPNRNCPNETVGLSVWLGEVTDLTESWRQTEATLFDKCQFIKTLKQALIAYNNNVAEQKQLDMLLPRLKRALEIVEKTRKDFTGRVLSGISEKVGELYEKVHPGEGLNNISLVLDPTKRASLDMGANFGEKNSTPPQAYFSQSHLDTLGICVFLALAAMEKPDATILVLDDVLASVDEPHVDRLIEMLYEEALQFRHCTITTHYRPWKQKLRWGWLKNGQCHFVELTKWSEARGITVIRSTPDMERLRQLLEETPPDPQLICGKAGVVLEATLDFLTQLYECEIPRRQNGMYTLGDLLPAIKKPLRNKLRVDILRGTGTTGEPDYDEVQLGPLLGEIERIAQARNVFGAHFNELSFDLLDADAISFAEQVLVLIETLVDPEKGWPKNPKSGEYWATSGETRRLHPLKKPG